MRLFLIVISLLISPLLLAYNITHASDSLLHLLKSTPSSQQKIRIYRHLADIYYDTSEAKTYLLKMYDEAAKIKDYDSMIDALNDILIEEANTVHTDSVAKYANLLKAIPRPEKVKSLLPIYRMRLFNAQCIYGKKDEAIEESLHKIDSLADDVYTRIVSNYNIGVSFYANGKYGKSLPYFYKALELAESLPEETKYEYKRNVRWKLSFASAQAGKPKESLKIMEKLIELSEQHYKTAYQQQRPFFKMDLYRLQYYSFMLSNLSYLNPEQEKFYWEKVQPIGKKLTNMLDKYNYYLCVNNYYSNSHTRKDLSKALAANDSLIKIAAIIGPQNLWGLYNTHSQIYEAMKDYPNALKYLKISYRMQDSLNTGNAQQQLNELQVKYNVKKLNSEKAQLEIQNKKTLILSLFILLIVVAGVCTYLYFSLKREKRMKIKLKVLNRKAQESEKMKQAFINSICHEIRTPLNAIVGFSDLIMNPEIEEEMRQEFPAEIQKNTVLLTNLVNSMLEVANLDVSEDKLPCAPTDLRAICIQQMERLERKPEIAYRLDIPEETTMIQTNEQYLTVVIEHLLSNANKFTEKGEITLGYYLNASRDKLTIRVSDTGCGIPEEKYEEVFNRFCKLNTFVAGNGLGLYLCRLIVTRLEGEIEIDPDYTEGTRMIVTLPV